MEDQINYQQRPWGSGEEWSTETHIRHKKKQWLFFNKDKVLVALVTSYPLGLNLEPYPVLRGTLSQLTPAREFFTNLDSLISETHSDTIKLYRTGDEKTTTQYLVRQNDDGEQDLMVAVIVLDPYETLLDGAQPEFLSPIKPVDNEPKTQHFLASQQFARGEIALFESCPGKKPDIAIDAYSLAIKFGLGDAKQVAEAHHRLGLALRDEGKLTEAREAIEESLTIQPYSPHVLNSLGIVLIQLKKPSQAITTFEKAITLQPNYARARFNLAQAYEQTNPRRAIDEYETYLALVQHIPEESTRAALAKDRLEKLK
ncbi:MAG: tetratricopeptide repeat protein [Nitrospirales bacterium]|nr:tetratricopeptide repeat protein [Nitrospirales bacterium]